MNLFWFPKQKKTMNIICASIVSANTVYIPSPSPDVSKNIAYRLKTCKDFVYLFLISWKILITFC